MILKGNPVSDGISLGKAYIYKAFNSHVNEAFFQKDELSKMEKAFENSLKSAEKELDDIIAAFSEDEEKGKIFVAHKEILFDEEIIEMIKNAISTEHKMPDYAVVEAFEEFIELLSKAKDPVIASRVVDFRDVRNRLVRILHGEKEKNLSRLSEPVIIVAYDLLPSDTATIDRKNVIGIITEVGSSTSHSAIIANSYNIAAVLGVKNAVSVLKDGEFIGLDALSGDIYTNMDEKTISDLEKKQKDYLDLREKEKEYLNKPFFTRDNKKLQLGLNIGGTESLDGYKYADFVGLFRTEFLYMENDHIPTEEEQFIAYKKVLQNANGKPVTLRTLDIGGDKQLDYLPLEKELNPFLGNRALRLCFSRPDLFKAQLRAAMRASLFGELWIMLPMVGSIDDITKARKIFDEQKQALIDEGIAIGLPESLKFGIMIEIPAIAMIADKVAKIVDFASIGTNDLCQYLFAVDRMNPALNDYYQPLAPSMIRTLSMIAKAFIKENKPISVCGELAGDKYGSLILAGLGIDKLSMSENHFAYIKAMFSRLNYADIKAAAEKALELNTEYDVKLLLNNLLRK